MTAPLQPGLWHDVLGAFATAFAALLGLYFVAFTLRPQAIEESWILETRAVTNLYVLVSGLIISLCLLVPQSNEWQGIEVIAANAVFFLLQMVRVWPAIRSPGLANTEDWLQTAFVPVGVGLGIAGGASLMANAGPGLYLILPTLLSSLAVTTRNAWRVIFPRA